MLGQVWAHLGLRHHRCRRSRCTRSLPCRRVGSSKAGRGCNRQGQVQSLAQPLLSLVCTVTGRRIMCPAL